MTVPGVAPVRVQTSLCEQCLFQAFVTRYKLGRKIRAKASSENRGGVNCIHLLRLQKGRWIPGDGPVLPAMAPCLAMAPCFPAMAPCFRPLGETFGGRVASVRLQIFYAAGDLGRRGQAVEHEEPADDRA